MQIVGFFILGTVLIALQTSVFQVLPSWFGMPDLVFILIAFLAYRFGLVQGLFLSFAFGWMMDVVSGIYLGMYLLEYLLIFFVLNLTTLNTPVKESIYQVPLTGLSYFLVQVALYAVLSMMVDDSLLPWSWGRAIQETMVLTVATIPCFLLFNSFNEYLIRKRTTRRAARRRTGNQYR